MQLGVKHVPESLSQLCVGGKKKCVLEGVAPLHDSLLLAKRGRHAP